ncbi:MAG: cytochrome C oxidase assembly protein [Pseudomonadota bacterium]
MAMKREHELHDRRRGRNLGVLVLLLGFIAMLFFVTIVKLGEGGSVMGNPSAGQGGAWIDGFLKWVRG